MYLKLGIHLKWNLTLYLTCDVSLLADVFEKFSNSSLKVMDYVQATIWVHQL